MDIGANTGGRISLQPNTEVRILLTDGRISSEVYEVDSGKSDRKGHTTLKERGTNRLVKVQFRRIIPIDFGGQAVVIESNSKCRAVCPKCNYVEMVTAASEYLNCPTHGKFQLYWLGAKPMAEVAEKEKVKKEKPASKTPRAEKAPRVARQQPTKIDLNAIVTTQHCELWTRKNVKFDHAKINVQSHVVLYTGDQPRKYCFNTYDGLLGKRSGPLPITEFVNDSDVSGEKKKPWYAVEDLEKARAKLRKDGYELVTKK